MREAKIKLQVGSALTLLIVGIVAAAVAIAGGVYLYKQSSSPNDLAGKIEVKLLSTGISVFCKPEGVEAVKTADLAAQNASLEFEKCRKETGQFSGNCDTNCKDTSDKEQKECNDKINSNSISLDEFESCVKGSNEKFRTCLASCTQNPQGYQGNFQECQQKNQAATEILTNSINKYCQ